MPRSHCYLAVFDITDDRERLKTAKCLEGYGSRVQKSVFECRLGAASFSRLRKDLNSLAPETGHVSLYRVGHRFDRSVIGKAPDPPPESDDSHSVVL